MLSYQSLKLLVGFIFLFTSSGWACYQLPFPAKFKTRITQSWHGQFSHRPPYQYSWDLDSKRDTPIHAARSGVVIKSVDTFVQGGGDEKFKPFANHIILKHSDGEHSLYSHLSPHSSLVEVEEKVKRGQLLAKSGCTGWCSAPHLHFEIFRYSGHIKGQRITLPRAILTEAGPVTFAKVGDQLTTMWYPESITCDEEK